MAQYWVYLNDAVAGPYGLEQLIRLRGFSRQTLVSIDDHTGKPTNWISPAEIPELAHIFKAADEQLVNTPSHVPSRAASKPAPRPRKAYTPAVVLKAPSRGFATYLPWLILISCLLAGGFFAWSHHQHQSDQEREQAAAQSLVENAHLPAPSPYGSLIQYIQDKGIKARWEIQRTQDALYHVSLSWYGSALTVYAFEVNVQAQTVRGLNSAAAKLLSEGFPAPPSAAPKSPVVPKKATPVIFSQAVENRRAALESGDFESVWNLFSQRKKNEMARGGISREGFLRLQGLTHRVDSGMRQSVLKTKDESNTQKLVLIKQEQTGKPDIFVKQLWVLESDAWKLDDEEKHSAQDSGSKEQVTRTEDSGLSSESSKTPQSSALSPDSSSSKPPAASLPGMAH